MTTSRTASASYFVWLNRGKELVVLDLAKPDDKALLAAMLAKADVFVQNLKPGAVAQARLPDRTAAARASAPDRAARSRATATSGPYAARKAYDLLIQAEVGLASITGGPSEPARVGVSVCDIGAGMNAYEAILEALIVRGRTGEGAELSVSLFDAMADWMAMPLLQQEGGKPPKRVGLAHTSIAPYGVFKSRDGVDVLISIQSDREWRVLAEQVLGDEALAADPNFASNVERVKRRAETDGRVAAVFASMDVEPLDREARRRRHRVRAGERSGRARAASASAADRGRHAGRRRQLSGAGRPPRRRDPAVRRGAVARRAHRQKSAPSSLR